MPDKVGRLLVSTAPRSNIRSLYRTAHVALGRWKLYFQSRRGTLNDKPVWKWYCLQPHCDKSFVQSGGGGSLTYHMTTCHRDLFNRVSIEANKQLTLTEMMVPASKKDKVAYSGLQWLIADFLPFSTFDSPNFRQFMKTTSPMLTLPSAATVRSKLPTYRLQLYTKVVELMDRTMVGGSMTMDSWTSRSNRPFLAVTFQWLDRHFQQHECVLDMAPQPYPHTGPETARLVSKCDDLSRFFASVVHSFLQSFSHIVHFT